jgi:anti-repressor protein
MSTEVKLGTSQSRGYENYDMELIKVTTNEQGKKLVSGRELHEVLEIGRDFTTWIKKMIEYGFMENEDYILLTKTGEQKGRGGHNKVDYILTLDMAKHIAMVQRTEIGMRVRNYFIECEKVAHNPYQHLSKELQFMIQLEQNQNQLDQRLVKLENNMTIDYQQQLDIQNAVARSAIKALGGYDSYAYRNKTVNRKTFNAIYKMLKTTFQVNSYKNIPTKSYDVAKELIAAWQPNEDLALMIRGANVQMVLGDAI